MTKKPLKGNKAQIEIVLQRGSKFGAMAFGSLVPTGKVSYPTSPTWMSYNGDDSKCMDNVPLLLRPELFCDAFLAEARVFRYPVSMDRWSAPFGF